jgi:hypothetical protein
MKPDWNMINASMDGIRGKDQKRIAEIGIGWLQMLLAKNADYGSSAWAVPALAPQLSAGDAILVRMSDKIERLKSLLAKGTSEVAESLEDTIGDLGAYCLLYLARPQEGKEPQK